MSAYKIIAELENSIAGIHPTMEREPMLREARTTMVHALEFIRALPAPPPVRSAHARNSDPATSKAAAQSDMSKMERAVHAIIAAYDDVGCTQDELLAAFPSSKSQSVMPRVKPLVDKGYAYVRGDTRTGASGKEQRVIRATDKEMPT